MARKNNENKKSRFAKNNGHYSFTPVNPYSHTQSHFGVVRKFVNSCVETIRANGREIFTINVGHGKLTTQKHSSVELRRELMFKVAFLNGMISGDVTKESAKSSIERELYSKFSPLSISERRNIAKSMAQEVVKIAY